MILLQKHISSSVGLIKFAVILILLQDSNERTTPILRNISQNQGNLKDLQHIVPKITTINMEKHTALLLLDINGKASYYQLYTQLGIQN